MTRALLTAIFLTLFSQTAWAHKCILSGSTAEDITAYNTCKADLANKTSGHEILELRNRIKSLEAQLGTSATQTKKKEFIIKCGNKTGSKIRVIHTFLLKKELDIYWIDSRLPDIKNFLPKTGGQTVHTEFSSEYMFSDNGTNGLSGTLTLVRYTGAYRLSWAISGSTGNAVPGYCEKASSEKLF